MNCEAEAKRIELCSRYEYVVIEDREEELLDTLLAQGWDVFTHVFLMTPERPDPRSEDHPFLQLLYRERDEPRTWTKREIQKIAADTLGIGNIVSRA